jgi:Protein of unknown function (DUF2510)
VTAYQPAPPMAPPAGWYPDPSGTDGERWWTGGQWSEHTRKPDGDWGALSIIVPQPSTHATRALVWGIVSVLLPVAFIPSLLAIVFGASSIGRETARERQGLSTKRSRALAGLVLGIVGLVLAIGIFIALPLLLPHATSCGC